MSKRKNTLNDLEEFLKLQASTLVPPQPVETSMHDETPKPVGPVKEELIVASQPVKEAASIEPAKALSLLEEMKKLAIRNKDDFYDHIIQTVEAIPNGTNDVLLINTALYLKHGENWKTGIEEYWRKRKAAEK